MYITTSRKPSLTTKRLCRLLASLIPLAVYENRGKRSVEELAERADSLGKERACVLQESHGNPAGIVFMKVGGKAGWGWLSPEILIRRIRQARARGRAESLEISGEKKGVLKELLKPAEIGWGGSEAGGKVFLDAGKERIVFSDGKRELLALEVEYNG